MNLNVNEHQFFAENFSVVVPIVISFSPIGALVSSYLHRQVIASFLYVLDTLAIVSIRGRCHW